MNVQTKNLVRNIRQIADEIEKTMPARVEAEDVTVNWRGPRLMKCRFTDCRWVLEITYPNQED
jgi:hypothetical protein